METAPLRCLEPDEIQTFASVSVKSAAAAACALLSLNSLEQRLFALIKVD
jgi:hypothetical protein